MPVDISHTIDGDTVTLSDGSRLRLIGIDTPELGREQQPHQPGAERAKNFLRTLLTRKLNHTVLFGLERKDRHGRHLGHLFLEDGSNVQAMLLREGLATPLVVPPNNRLSDCYARTAAQAIADNRGLWALPRYKIKHSSGLTPGSSGYHRIQGKITRVSSSPSSLWLSMSEKFAIRIHKSDLNQFNRVFIDSLPGKMVTVRGHLYRRKGQYRIRLRHGSDIETTTLPSVFNKTDSRTKQALEPM